MWTHDDVDDDDIADGDDINNFKAIQVLQLNCINWLQMKTSIFIIIKFLVLCQVGKTVEWLQPTHSFWFQMKFSQTVKANQWFSK